MKMKSKSFSAGSSSSATKIDLGHNNTFDFIRLYKTAEETKATLQKYKTLTEGSTFNDDTRSPKLEKLASKRKKGKQTAVEMTHISIDGLSLDRSNDAGPSTPAYEVHKATSTPITSKDKVKSIMKSTTSVAVVDDVMDGSKTEVFSPKPKKRNKSVSFMLDDNEQVEIKKTKSEDNIKTQPTFKTNKLKKKLKKDRLAEKENKVNDNLGGEIKKSKDKSQNQSSTLKLNEKDTPRSTTDTNRETEEKKKRNKPKKARKLVVASQSTSTPEITQLPAEKPKKAKKKKRELKAQTDNDEPAQKFAKKEEKEIKPELIAEDLSNLSIGDNPTTLSSLLDEMSVTDKDKKKKLRKKNIKSRKVKSKETAEVEQQKSEEIKEKKWKRKRWNKEKKLKDTTESLTGAVIVDNLPISLLVTYKKVLAEYFAKCGLLKSVGIAEVYPSEVSKPVFTTTVFFDTEDAVTKALEEDQTTIEGSKIRVSRPLTATQTTAVVRTYGALSEQALTSAFAGAGRIRTIRLAVKGKNTMSTAFIEFDGPAAVERAIKMVEDVKIGGKKIHVSKFEIRPKKNREEKSGTAASDADHSDNGDLQN